MFKKTNQNKGFKCQHCNTWVTTSTLIGTSHRNHCPFCLWSKHVDLKNPGDRKSQCGASMEPIGLTFKNEGKDKYGKTKQGELMLIHQCTNRKCNKISINRIAADDSAKSIIDIFEKSQSLDNELIERLKNMEIRLLGPEDKKEVYRQLFGEITEPSS